VIDLHSHLLPGVDDGSRTLEQSLQVLNRMADAGVTGICLTPHLEASRAHLGVPQAYDAAYERLRAAAPERIRLSRGVEMMLDRHLPAEAAANRQLTLGGSRYMLVEFTRMAAPLAVTRAVTNIVSQGLAPLLAHPERYACCSPAVAAGWKSAGALLQVDANTLFMPRGRGDRARQLLAAGLADILAADNHGDDRSVSAPYVSLCEQGGEVQADLLLVRNPAAILADQLTEDVPALTLKTSFFDRLKQLLDPEG
jgi:protein-tyrosine phosphatase